MSKIPVIDTCWECPYCVEYKEPYEDPRNRVYGPGKYNYGRDIPPDVREYQRKLRNRKCKRYALDVEEFKDGIHPECKLQDYKGS